MSCENGSSKLLTGLIIGAAAGSVIGILMAPRAGRETREKLKNEAEKLKEELKNCSNDLKVKTTKFKNDFEEKLEKIKSKLKSDIDSN